jgi:hypothetical protein
MAKMDVKGRIANGGVKATVFQTDTDKPMGILDGARSSSAGPIDDYGLINRELMSAYDQKIYDRRVLQSREWKKFARQMERFAARHKTIWICLRPFTPTPKTCRSLTKDCTG